MAGVSWQHHRVYARFPVQINDWAGGVELSRQRSVHILAVALVVLALTIAAIPAFGSTTGIVSGTVTDLATGNKLAGVNMIIEGTNLTTVTDKDGYFVITNVPPGEYKVTASLVGYSDFQVSKVNVLMDVTSTVDCALTQAIADEETIVVKESRPMIQRDVIPTTYVVDANQEQMIRSQPSSMYQTPALVLTQPGVVGDEFGYPHIRGGRGNEIAYLLDGIPITEPVTNGFGTNIVTVGLDKMEMYTGGYRPEYGNAVSGVFNQVIKTGRTAPGVSLEMMGGSDAYWGTYPQIGGAGEKFDYYAGGYVWHTRLEGQDFNEADSSDYVGKFNYDLDPTNKFTVVAGTGKATYLMPSTHTQTYEHGAFVATPETRDSNTQNYILNALTWTHKLNSASFFTVRPYYFRNAWNLELLHPSDFNTGDLGMWWDAASSTNGLMFDYTNQLSDAHLIKAGAVRMASSNRYWVNIPDMGYEYTANTNTMQTGLYLQDQMKLSPKWHAEAGLRYDLMHYDKAAHPDSNESQVSPRFGLSYAVSPKSNLRFSYGKTIEFVHTQALERVYTDPTWEDFLGLGNSDMEPQRSTQYDLGWEHQVGTDYSVQVTPFYRQMDNMLQYRSLNPNDSAAPPYLFDTLGKGFSQGVEFLVKKRASQNWSGWVSYTYSVAKAEASSFQATVTPGQRQYVDWDQRHTLVAVLNYNKNNWTYSLMGEYGSGLPYTLNSDTIMNTHRTGPHTVFNLNVSRDVKGGWLPAGELHFGIANIFDTHASLKMNGSGTPQVRVQPRFVNLSYIRRF